MENRELCAFFRAGKYSFSKHAERERQADKITFGELEEALNDCEIIEEYRSDPRGTSCLVLGFCGLRPIHAVCALKANPDEVLIITVYDPSKRSHKWTRGYRSRKE
jgi:proteasome assembly chaperone (PAC2) family protein